MKIILRIIAALTVFSISAFVLIQVPSVQDRIMTSVLAGMFNTSNNLPKEDSLSVDRDHPFLAWEELKHVFW